MARSKTPSFITEIPLKVTCSQERGLLKRLDAARQVYNACLGESLKRLDLLRQSKAYQAAQKLPKGKARSQAFREADAAIGFREYDLHAYAKQFGHCWIGDHLDANTIQTVATRAFRAVKAYALGKRGKPRFKGKDQMDSVEGKTNQKGIRWRDDHVEWLGLKLEAIIDPDDPVIAHGLTSHVKYVRLVRRKLNGRHCFYAQLVCEGQPYQKPQNEVGEGLVGLDIGPSTIAAVGDGQAFLEPFCAELEPRWKEIRRWQRKLDRQRRANNPQNYNSDGTIKLGPKIWHKSKRQRQTEAKLSEFYRKQAAHRKTLQGQMANRVLRMGDTIKLEKVSYRSFQRNYGKSVGIRAPGTFVSTLQRKAESTGAIVEEFPTCTTRLSQTCHGCGTVAKKPLSQRWHFCDCGIVAQRDLYSAFLARCVVYNHDSGIYRLDVAQATAAWAAMEPLLRAASGRNPTGECPPVGGQPREGTEPVARDSLWSQG